mgnify:CR=1 FL=1
MSTNSILDTIMNQVQAEKIGRLDVIEMIEKLFVNLNEREQDILKRRFGLINSKKATLEEIGQTHHLTRERIRQIETGSINKIKKLEQIGEVVSDLRTLVNQLLEDHGGTMDKDYLFDILLALALDTDKTKDTDNEVYKNHFNFILGKILDGDFKEINDSKHFNPLLSQHFQEFEHLEEIAEDLLKYIKTAKRLFVTTELLETVGNLDSFKKHQAKLTPENKQTLDLTKTLADILPGNDAEPANNAKALYALLRAIADIEQNKFGDWGHREWRDVKPKTINDKIYLVLKNNGKPMHYQDIGKMINETGFDGKSVNTATVHNELILDDKYVLVGRGLYALKEWGYSKGTVADIIADILKEAGQPLTKKDITEKVMKQRMVKKTTIDLALMNKKRFERITGGKYTLVSSN